MPPKTTRRSAMDPVAKAELGSNRECRECGEVKPVSPKTYTRSKKGLRGWKTTCKVCDAVASAERRGNKIKPRETKSERSTRESLITEMYRLAETNRDPQRIDEIKTLLSQTVLDELDPRKSFMNFVDIVKPLVAGWKTPGAIHDDIIGGLLSPHRRRLVIATRYSAKSTLTGIYVAWRIYKDPLIKIMLISRGSKLASRMLRSVRKVYIQNCPMLQHLMPTEDCLDNAEQFQTPQSAQVTTGGATLSSFGVTSDLPGYRADLTIGDDVEGPSDDTPEKVAELLERLNELHMINPVGEKIMLGTYQTEFSIYAQYADQADSETGEPVWENHRACMFEELEDGTIKSRWVDMFSDKDAVDWRRSVTTRAWRLHALLIADPSILNERPLKIGDIPVIKCDARKAEGPIKVERTSTNANLPTWGAPRGDEWRWGSPEGNSAYAHTVAAIDPASGLAGRDAIGVAIVSVTPAGFAIIRHLEGVRGLTKADNMRRCALLMRTFKVKHLVIEELQDGFFGDILEGELQNIEYPMTVEKVTTGGQQKGRRIIECLAPSMGDGRICIIDSVVESDDGGEFTNQMTRISYDGNTGKGRQHDDIVDALAHAIAHIKGSITSDVTSNLESLEIERIDRLRYIPLRSGGLGGYSEDHNTQGGMVGRPTESGLEDLSMAELLYEEDTVLSSMVARRDALQARMEEERMLAMEPLKSQQRRLAVLNQQIKDLREHKLL